MTRYFQDFYSLRVSIINDIPNIHQQFGYQLEQYATFTDLEEVNFILSIF